MMSHPTFLAAMRDSSNLLAHEAAFALGQMQDVDAIPALETVLNDLSLHPIVRHEVRYHYLSLCSCIRGAVSFLIYSCIEV